MFATLCRRPAPANHWRRARPTVAKRSFWELPALATFGAAIGFYLYNYTVAASDQWLVRTGMWINTKSGLAISRTAFVWPIVQKCAVINLRPRNFPVSLMAKSQGMMGFGLPAVFTISPENTPESLEKYALRLLKEKDGDKSLDDLVYAIIEGELRGVASGLPITRIFNDRPAFKTATAKNIGEELTQFGLKLDNANIKELFDAPGSEYFKNMQMKNLVDAKATADIATAEAIKNTAIGQKERERDQRIRVVKFEQEAVECETEIGITIAESVAALKVAEAEQEQKANVAQLEAVKRVEIRAKELEKDVEEKRIATEKTTYQANELTKTQVDAEVLVTQSQAKAEAIRLVADANLHKAQAEATGEKAKLFATADGTRAMVAATGGEDTFIKNQMILYDQYEKIAREQGKAINGLQPDIRIWNTGSAAENAKTDWTSVFNNLVRVLPAQMTAVEGMTGKPFVELITGGKPLDQATLQSLAKAHGLSPDDVKNLTDTIVAEKANASPQSTTE
uniref:Band 7 domain-containing protein n=1 Tax=Marseillevirus LCMAC103 TaxID=2506604 RepID=A0A481YW66_9VIRU|nr:MAG: protein of unknown function DUF4670 [Marseillevirus LCMAC103]